MQVDVEALERATLAAVPPQRVVECEGWLVGLDDGTVGRAHSAVPLRHHGLAADSVEPVLRAFSQAARPPVFRIPRAPAFDDVCRALQAHGLASSKPTLAMTGTVAALCALDPASEVTVAGAPDEAWSRVFLGEGFDPVDAASRIAILRRGRESVFASARIGTEVAAVGAACTAFGWCGIHGMRTAPRFRGRGLASAILAVLARHAAARGVTRAFLQVEQANAAAQRLYRRGGFDAAWCYDYWVRS